MEKVWKWVLLMVNKRFSRYLYHGDQVNKYISGLYKIPCRKLKSTFQVELGLHREPRGVNNVKPFYCKLSKDELMSINKKG